VTVIFGAGGTAGHVFMALGIAQHVQDKKILITDQRGIKYVCSCEGCKNKAGECEDPKFDEIYVLPIKSARFWDWPKILFSIAKCLRIFYKNKDVIYFGCGAYTSLIAGIAAILKHAPIHLYQGDQVIGSANKFLQHFATRSWTSSSELGMKNNTPVGCIVRDCIVPKPMVNDGTFRILILGSSIGSSMLEFISPDAIAQLDPELRSKIRVKHQNRKPEELLERYKKYEIHADVQEFFDTRNIFEQAHLVIARSGWSLLSDVIASERAAIFIPWDGAKQKHQYYNALWISPNKEWMLEENKITVHDLSDLINRLANDMFEQNAGNEFITNGIIAERVKFVNENFSANAGKVIGKYLTQRRKG
jgi:UDP-N-acetylglucosamine--N-acetylmuramyl-(pentapeptide) pyrophosphoryl-undecaprenol N-acetylglucosamine transferase